MKNTTAFFIGLTMGLLVCYNLRHCQTDNQKNTGDSIIHIAVYDTVRYRMPVAYDSVVIRYVERYVPVSQSITDSTVICPKDTLPVVIPITQKTYRDSTYEAWISGYEAKLDSINVYNQTIMHTVYKAPSQKAKRWGVGVQAGCGYGKQGFSPYIGVGVQYNFVLW